MPPILDQDRYVNYPIVAATTNFAFPFPLFGQGDLKVVVNGTVIDPSAYSVTSAAYGNWSLAPNPVTDTVVVLNSAVSNSTVEIYGSIRPQRAVQATAPFSTFAFNYAFSYLAACLRELYSQFTRAIQAPVGESSLVLPNKAARSGQVLGFDANGIPAAVGDYASISNGAATATAAAASAAASAAAAQTFNPSNYVTTTALGTTLQGYVPASRKLSVSSAMTIGGTAGGTADLSADRSLDLSFASAATAAVGTDTAKPVNSAGVAAAVLAQTGLIQSKSATYTATTSLSAAIPGDSTIPQVGEGTQVLSVTITPKLSTSKLRVRFQCSAAVSGSGRGIAAMFLNGGANAVAASSAYQTNTGNFCLTMEYEFSPGSTSAQTITVRAGPATATGLVINTIDAASTLGGVMGSTLIVEEVN